MAGSETERIHYDKFYDLYTQFENIVSKRCKPPTISCKVDKVSSKKIAFSLTAIKAEYVILFATTVPLKGDETFFDNFEYLKKFAFRFEKIDFPKSESEDPVEFNIFLGDLTRKSEYYVYYFAGHSTSITGRPNRTSNEIIFKSVILAETSAKTEVRHYCFFFFFLFFFVF